MSCRYTQAAVGLGNVFESLRTAGFDGTFVPVHPRYQTVFGVPARASLCDLKQPVDLAFVLVPTEAVEGVISDAAAAGVRNLVILAAGFGEQGEAGRQQERRVVDLATLCGIVLLGPNGLGFIKCAGACGAIRSEHRAAVDRRFRRRGIASGVLASAVLSFARGHAIGLSLLISVGTQR